MIRYLLRTPAGPVVLSLAPPAGKVRGPLEYKGDPTAIAMLDSWLSPQLDEFGVRIDRFTTVEGLRAALASPEARMWSPERLR